MSWFASAKPSRQDDPGDEKFATAMQVASEVLIGMHSLVEQIRPFHASENPFTAIVTARDSAIPFEQDQESRFYAGPKG